VLTALDVRDATIAATEQRAGAALQAMINDEHLTISETVQWRAGTNGHREATRLRKLADQTHSQCPDDTSHLTGIRSQDAEGDAR
jgi:hypothetical protein